MTLVRTTDLIGKEVKSTQGETLGVIHDIVLSSDYQQVSYAALAYGGAFSSSSRLYAIPWQALRAGPKGDLTMSATKDQFGQAPGFTNRNWPSQAETRWLGAGAGTPGAAATAPSAAGSSAAGAAAPGSTTGNQAATSQSRTGQSAAAAGQSQTTHRHRRPPGQMAAGSQEVQMRRVTHLTGLEVKNTENQDLGDLEGFAINASDGRVMTTSSRSAASQGRREVRRAANAGIQPRLHAAILNATRQTLDSVAPAQVNSQPEQPGVHATLLGRSSRRAPAGGAPGYVRHSSPRRSTPPMRGVVGRKHARQGFQSQHGQDDHGHGGAWAASRPRVRPRELPAGCACG
jgi:sporulation protein YlmC with PRC-barrel domain